MTDALWLVRVIGSAAGLRPCPLAESRRARCEVAPIGHSRRNHRDG